MKPKDIPNIISVVRIFAVLPIVALLLQGEYGWAMLIFALAGASDALDGFLAKHYSWQSRLGGILDPIADKALLISCFLVLGWQGLIPPWLVSIVLLRDLVIVTGALVYNFRVESLEASPILVSKLNTLVQILLVVMVIMHAGPIPVPDEAIAWMVWLCLSTVVVSGVEYVWIWSRKARLRGWKRRDVG